MRELSAGVCNVLKSHNARPMSAGYIMSKLEANDHCLEANLQYLFAKQSEHRCMVRVFGTPTLFSHI